MSTLMNVVFYCLGLLILFVVGRWITSPINRLTKLLVNSVLGGLFILVLNYVGASFDVFIALNPITAILVGILGIPGVLLLLILQYML